MSVENDRHELPDSQDDSGPKGVEHIAATLQPGAHDDAEATSAANASWLAELRASAGAERRTLADVIDDDSDDEVTIAGSADALLHVRLAVQDARGAAPDGAHGAHDVAPWPDADTPPVTERATPGPLDADASPTLPPPLPAALSPTIQPPSRGPRALATGQPADPEPIVGSRLGLEPSRPVPSAEPRRWEPPPRLQGARVDADAPIMRAPTRRHLDWRIAAAALTGAVLLGVMLASLLSGGNTPVAPDDTVVVDSGPVTTDSGA